MRGATFQCGDSGTRHYISIHAPHARSDCCCRICRFTFRNFNPRSSCEERLPALPCGLRQLYFNPRSSCEERPIAGAYPKGTKLISIHAPHARSDKIHAIDDKSATISIHAPHARSDRPGRTCGTCQLYFNPRSSCEERHTVGMPWDDTIGFQSTLLMRGATYKKVIDGCIFVISIHAPHARSDCQIPRPYK